MAKVLGLGGFFFKSREPVKLGEWYQQWLGMELASDHNSVSFKPETMPEKGCSVWAPFKHDTDYFAPSDQPTMVNLIVDDVAGALAQVKEGGATIIGEVEEYEYGTFGWFLDPEGNKVELWMPA
jgi:predicted enzyme related to lactoylglutathione lyase